MDVEIRKMWKNKNEYTDIEFYCCCCYRYEW